MPRRKGRQHRKDIYAAEQDTRATAGLSPQTYPYRGGRYKPLSDLEVGAIHDAVLHLLETVGLSQAIPSVIEKVCANGGSYTDDERLLFPRALVLDMIQKANRNIVLYGQRQGLELALSDDHVYMSSGGAAPNIIDIDTGLYRPSKTQDLYDAARVVDAMKHIHHFSRSVVVRDTSDNLSLDVNTLYASLKGTAKHVSISVTEAENVKHIADICYRIAGGQQNFRNKPFVTIAVFGRLAGGCAASQAMQVTPTD